MAKNYSLKSELLAIRTICVLGNDRAGQYLLGKLKQEHFASEIARSSWKRLSISLKKSGSIPDWESLITDPGLDDSVREALEDVDYEPVSTKKGLRSLVRRLNDYRKNRLLLEIGIFLDKKLNSSEGFDPDEVIQQVSTKLSGATATGEYKVLHIGQKANVDRFIDSILEGEAIRYIPTGIEAFDSKNRGIIENTLTIIAGETGGGKSALIGTLATNMALNGAHVAVIPLEMTNLENLQRDVARNTGVDLNDLIDPDNRMSREDKVSAKAMYLRYSKRIAKRGGRISTFEFDEDVTIEQLLATLQPFGYDVIFIDYIGLLSGLDGDDQWRVMNNAVRYGKVWSRKKSNSALIIAAQLSKEGMLKHSKSMMDHANLAFTWKRDELFLSTGIAQINLPKARQQDDTPFLAKFDFPKMLVRDVTAKEAATFNAGSKPRKEGKRIKRWESDTDDAWDTEPKEKEIKSKRKRVEI